MDELKPHLTSHEKSVPSDNDSSPNEAQISIAYERKLLWKLDVHIMPILYCLFIIMLIDRVNIGNVKIEGIIKDLHMKGNDYNIALIMHSVPFIAFELPSSLMLRRVRPAVWISGIMFGWGECSFV